MNNNIDDTHLNLKAPNYTIAILLSEIASITCTKTDAFIKYKNSSAETQLTGFSNGISLCENVVSEWKEKITQLSKKN